MAEAQTERELHERHQELVRALAREHALAATQVSEDDVSDEVFDALVERAQALMTYEEQLPALLAEPQRLRSERIVFWSWRAQSAVAAALMGAALLLGHSGWWLLLLVPHLVATFCGWQLKTTLKDHLDRRYASIGLHVVTVLLALVVLGVISSWFLIAVLIGWALVGGGLASDSQGAGE
ncbi:hypothetical protein AB0I75_32215 [Streptomyces sp. NPDC050273]|uniref:hypothetical protein n=1 Tax=Streptomyces sp. NPDC050273 TaxID=3154933 RepID=UPI00343E3878